MGRCHDFGVDIRPGCEHPMRPGEDACACPECDAVCEGRFKGCVDVWARGPRPIQLAPPMVRADQTVGNGRLGGSHSAATGPLVSYGGAAEGGTKPHEVANAGVNVLRWPESSFNQRPQMAIIATVHDEARLELQDALVRERTELSEGVAAAVGRLDQLLGEMTRLAADQEAHKASMAASHDELRTELHGALSRQRSELSEAFAASTGAVNDAAQKVTELATELSAAAVRTVQDETTHTRGLLSELKDLVVETHRDGSREAITEGLRHLTHSLDQAVAQAVADGVKQGEDRFAKQSEKAIRLFRRFLEDAQETEAQYRNEAARTETERAGELHAHLTQVSEALRETHALAAAQREETDLLDAAMSTLHDSLGQLQASVAAQHMELREELARQRRSSSASLRKHLRSITESLPEVVAAAAKANEEETLQRIERALAKLRRSVDRNQPVGSRPQK